MNEKKNRRGSILKVLENTNKLENTGIMSRPKKRVSFAPEPFVKILKEDKCKIIGPSLGDSKENNLLSESKEIDRLLKGQIIGSNDLCSMFTAENSSDAFKINMMTSGFEKPFDIATRFLANGDKKLRRSQIGSIMLDNSLISHTPSVSQSPSNLRRSPRIKAKVVQQLNDSLMYENEDKQNNITPLNMFSKERPSEISVVSVVSTQEERENQMTKSIVQNMSIQQNKPSYQSGLIKSNTELGERQSVIMDISDSINDSSNNNNNAAAAAAATTAACVPTVTPTLESCAMEISVDTNNSIETRTLNISNERKTKETSNSISPALEIKSVLMDTSFYTKIESSTSFDPNYSHSVVQKAKEHQDKILNLSHDLRIFLNMSMTECADIVNQSINVNHSFKKLSILESPNVPVKLSEEHIKLLQLKEEINNMKKYVSLKIEDLRNKQKNKTNEKHKNFQECLSKLENSSNCFISQVVEFENYKSNIARCFEDLVFKRKISFNKYKGVLFKPAQNTNGILMRKIDQLQKKHGISFNIIDENKFHIVIQHFVSIDLYLNNDHTINHKNIQILPFKSFNFYHNIYQIVNQENLITNMFNQCNQLEEVGNVMCKCSILIEKMILFSKKINVLIKSGHSIIFRGDRIGFRFFVRSLSCFIIWLNISILHDINLSITFSSIDHALGVDWSMKVKEELECYLNENKFEVNTFMEYVLNISTKLYNLNICSEM